MAASSASRPWALATPTDEPVPAGLTKTGYGNFASTASSTAARLRAKPSRVTSCQSAWRTPACEAMSFVMVLSMQAAEAATCGPT